MREIYKNPILYYLLIPVLVGLWPLLVWGVYLPRNQQQRDVEQSLLVEGETHIFDILRIAPEKLIIDPNATTAEFSYGREVDQVANRCAILPGNCDYSAGNIVEVSGKKRQEARIRLTNVSIVQAAKFLSTIQSKWANLTCENVKLTKKKGMPDQWEVVFNFLYYY